MADLPDAVVEEMLDATKDLLISIITVEGTLQQPYRDKPELSPWTRFVEKEFKRTSRAHEALRQANLSTTSPGESVTNVPGEHA